jgi:hypothetical protein
MGSGTRALPNANATGTFAELPLAHALVYIRSKRLSGVLDLRAPGGRQSWVVFWRGNIASITNTPTIARFGIVAYELGYVDVATIDETAQESARTKRPQADILIARRAIDYAAYERIALEQIRRRIQLLFSYPASTMFLFREGKTSLSAPERITDVLAPAWRGIRAFPPVERIREVLADLGDREIRQESEDVLEHGDLDPADASVCEALLAGPKSLTELYACSHAPPERVDLVVYFLLVSRCAVVESPDLALLPTSAVWAAAHRREHESGEVRRTDVAPAVAAAFVRGPADLGADAIRGRAARITDESPHEVLGVERGASVEAVRAAFLRLRRLWHPDKLPTDLEELRPEVARIFHHMAAAHLRLTDPVPRKQKVGSRGSR